MIQLLLLLALSTNAFAAEERSQPRRTHAGLCSLFLTPAFLHPAWDPVVMFDDGKPLTDLTGVRETTGGQIEYLSPLGPTLWTADEFGSWLELQKRINWNSPSQVQKLISQLMHEAVIPGVSTEMSTRLRNSFLAHQEGLVSRNSIRQRFLIYEARLARGASGPEWDDPLLSRFANPSLATELPETFHKLPLKTRRNLLPILAEVETRRQYDEATYHLRRLAPAFNLEFTDDGEIRDYMSALWIGRMILREPVIRHLRVMESVHLDEETLFLLAAFPEMVPHWPLIASWRLDFRHYPLELGSGFYHLRTGPLNPEGDTLILDLKHAISSNAHLRRKEMVQAHLRFNARPSLPGLENPIDDTDARRLAAFVENEWRAFCTLFPCVPPRAPQLQADPQNFTLSLGEPLSLNELVSLFFFLSLKYPAPGGG